MHDAAYDLAKDPEAAVAARGRAAYLREVQGRFWRHWRTSLGADEAVLEPLHREGKAPPVFRRAHADMNLLLPPGAGSRVRKEVTAMVPAAGRHRWFASMASSQALAQSVFGGLAVLGRLDVLEGLEAEDGRPAFFESSAGFALELEHAVSTLGEPRPTSVDALLEGPRRVAVEVKLTEADFGRCSRPRLTPADDNFGRDHCDGSFSVQRGRGERCSLSEIGVRYWEYVPRLFLWSGSQDHAACPVSATYQLVRNVLAACVAADGTLDVQSGHALVVFDERNPAFLAGGAAHSAWRAAIGALRHPHLLRRVSWQKLASHLDHNSDLAWLAAGLRDKYGLAVKEGYDGSRTG